MPKGDENSAAMSEDEVVKAAKNLWLQYLSMTQELLKFIDAQDIEMFTTIVNQREQLIEKIDELPSREYRKLDEFKAIADKIKPLDREIMYKARAWLNKSRRQNSMVRSYDLGISLAMNHTPNFSKRY